MKLLSDKGFLVDINVPSSVDDTFTVIKSFIISKADTSAIQSYVASARYITISDEAKIRYKDLAEFYKNYMVHLNSWEALGDLMTGVASDIHNYSLIVLKFLNEIQAGATKTRIIEIFQHLQSVIALKGKQTDDLFVSLTDFLNIIIKDKGANDVLQTKYAAVMTTDLAMKETNQKEIDEIKTDMAAQSKLLSQYLTNISTNMTYSWLGPLGLLVASYSTTINGNKATACLEKLKQDEVDLKTLTAEYSTLQNDILFIQNQTQTLINLTVILGPFIVTVQTLKGIWKAISDDFGLAIDSINDVNDAATNTIDLIDSLDDCKTDWQLVRDEADTFRTTYYITIINAPQ